MWSLLNSRVFHFLDFLLINNSNINHGNSLKGNNDLCINKQQNVFIAKEDIKLLISWLNYSLYYEAITI